MAVLLIAIVATEMAFLSRVRGTAAVVRISVLLAAGAVGFVVLASIPSALTRTAMTAAWAAAAIVLGFAVVWRFRRQPPRIARIPAAISRRARKVLVEEWIGAALLAVLMAGELVVGLATLPSSLDSLTYHLARVEHWRVNASVGPYPAMIDRQVMLAPGGEYLLLTVRLLADTVRLAPLVSWFSALGAVIVVHRITGQLGAGRRGRMVAAVLAATIPLTVLQASSTLNDLVVAFFLLCFVSLVLDFRAGGDGWRLAAVTGLALGLALLTKSTAYPLALGFGLWWAFLLVRRGWPGIARGAVAAVAAAAMVAPFLGMVTMVWGSPLGSGHVQSSVFLGRHDPVTIAMNATKIASAALVSGDRAATSAVCGAAAAVHDRVNRDVSDPATSFLDWGFRCGFNHSEMGSSAPWHTIIACAAIGICAFAGRRGQRAYAIATAAGAVAFVALIAYQWWITRLWLGGLMIACPLLPIAASRLIALKPSTTAIRPAVAGALLTTAALGALSSLVGGGPRPLFNAHLLKPTTVAQQMVPAYPEIPLAVDRVKATGARRIGLYGHTETQEFAFWVLLGATQDRTSIVILNSTVPGHRAPTQNLDAVLCIPKSVTECDKVIPTGWTRTIQRGRREVLIALPPSAAVLTAPRPLKTSR